MASKGKPDARRGSSFVRRVRELTQQERLFPAGSRALVMVSGGQDSLALVHLLAKGLAGKAGPVSLHVLHINHHLRGAESEADEALVRRVCAEMGLGLTVVHCPVDKAKGNVQEAARDARREAAMAVAIEQDCARIALGHTADDQVETMLYRLGRYGGLGALTGMLPCDPPWVRPLLHSRREETEAYCLEQGLEFARDRGNRYPGYARTAIRERVIPEWEKGLPGAVAGACRTAEVAAEVKEVIAAVVAGAMAKVSESGEELSAAALLELAAPVRRLVLHEWLERRARPAASRAAVLAVESLLSHPGSGERALAGGWRAYKEYDTLRLERAPRRQLSVPEPVALSVPGAAAWGDVVVTAEPVEEFVMPDAATTAYVDARSLTGPLVVRAPEPGDRLRPLGAPGTRKLQDVLVDLKVPAGRRRRLPLVVCEDRILWVCGLIVAEEGRVKDDSTAIVRLSLSSAGD